MEDNLVSELVSNSEIDLLQELETVNGTNFYFQNQKVMLTYKTHINKEHMLLFLRMVNGGNPPKKCYMAHENGKDDPITPYEHTHVVVDFGKRIQSHDCRFLDFTGIHPHISKITKPKSWKKACKYITKEDKTVILEDDDKFNDVPCSVTQVWNYKNMQEALQNTRKFSDVLPTIALFKCKPMEWEGETCVITDPEMFLPWQKRIWYEIHKIPDNRTIHWIYDEVGNNGKTQFMKYCGSAIRDKVMWLEPNGTVRDMLHVINYNINSNGWRGNTFIINLARSATTSSDMPHVYKLIENLKDGIIFSTKYEGGQLLMPSPHIIVLSNTMPDIHRLSIDRWNITSMTAERDLAPVTLNIGARSQKNGEFSPFD